MRTNVPVGGFQMAKRRSPSFVLSLELKEDPMLFSIIVDNLEICRVMYNTILGKYLKLETQMKREKNTRNISVSGKIRSLMATKVALASERSKRHLSSALNCSKCRA